MNLLNESTNEGKNMTVEEMKQASEALILWRQTEREMIANKTAVNMQAHSLAKRNARQVADDFIKRGVQP